MEATDRSRPPQRASRPSPDLALGAGWRPAAAGGSSRPTTHNREVPGSNPGGAIWQYAGILRPKQRPDALCVPALRSIGSTRLMALSCLSRSRECGSTAREKKYGWAWRPGEPASPGAMFLLRALPSPTDRRGEGDGNQSTADRGPPDHPARPHDRCVGPGSDRVRRLTRGGATARARGGKSRPSRSSPRRSSRPSWRPTFVTGSRSDRERAARRSQTAVQRLREMELAGLEPASSWVRSKALSAWLCG
jgi:hypothetical protein